MTHTDLPLADHEPHHEDVLRSLFDLGLEQTVLGCILMPGGTAGTFHEAAEHLTTSDFYRPSHQIIWQTLATMADRDLPLDPQALAAELQTAGHLDRVAGASYLITITEQGITPANASYYAKQAAGLAVRRRMHQATVTMRQIALTGTGEINAVLEDADQTWAQVQHQGQAVEGIEHFGQEMLADVIDDLDSPEDPMGVPTGFADLDALTNGLHPGELIVVAARPGVGKTTFGLNVAVNAAKAGHRTLFVSLEMNRNELGQRIISSEARVPLHTLRSKLTSKDDWARIAEKQKEMIDWPLMISHNPAITFPQLKAEIRRQARRHELKMVVLDYLQLLQDPESTSADTREREVALMTRGLKVLAQQIGIPIVVLCQLNRDSARREDKRPQTHEMRESGAVEQDANMILLLHREDVYDKESPRAGEADLIIGKNRNGPTCDVSVAFQGHYSQFVDMGQG